MKTSVEIGIKYLTEDNFDREDWQPGTWQHWTYARVNIKTCEIDRIGIYVHTRADLLALCNHWNRMSILNPNNITWVYYAI